MKPYSEDLRQKIVDALKRGMPKGEAASLFGVSLSSVKRFARMDRQGESLAPRKPPGRPPKSNDTIKRLLEADLAERPAATAAQRRRYLEHITGESMSDSTVRRLIRRLGHSRKKRSALASERDEFLRAAWRVMVSGELCAQRLVFVDEMGSNTSLHELYAYSPRGKRAYCSVARNRAKNTTLLSSMSLSGMGPSMVVEGGANGAVFEGYLREMLVPALKEGDVVVMDNLCVGFAHKAPFAQEPLLLHKKPPRPPSIEGAVLHKKFGPLCYADMPRRRHSSSAILCISASASAIVIEWFSITSAMVVATFGAVGSSKERRYFSMASSSA